MTKQSLAVLLGLLLGILSATAQGTLEFSVHLAGPNTDYTGQCISTLTDQPLAYDVSTPFGFYFGEIRRPGPDSGAPVILQLGFRQGSARLDHAYCTAPGPGGIGGGCTFRDAETITEGRAAELIAGQWYVYSLPDPSVPQFTISGQVVPEPSVVALLSLGLLAIGIQIFRFVQRGGSLSWKSIKGKQALSLPQLGRDWRGTNAFAQAAGARTFGCTSSGAAGQECPGYVIAASWTANAGEVAPSPRLHPPQRTGRGRGLGGEKGSAWHFLQHVRGRRVQIRLRFWPQRALNTRNPMGPPPLLSERGACHRGC